MVFSIPFFGQTSPHFLFLSLFGAKSNQKHRATFFASIPTTFW